MELVASQYKQTEIGQIPSDWNVVAFGRIISNLCYGPRFSAKDYSTNGNVKTIRGTDISRNGDIKYEQVPVAELPTRLVNEHKLVDGDLVMITTAECGLTGVYFDDGFPYIASAYAVRITLDSNAHSLFFKYLFQTEFAKEQVELYIRKGTVANLPGSGILKFKFALPPLHEQQAIAQVLSDTDKLIQSLEKKIAKKKLIKQGVMQQLLTPKDGWEVKKLGDYVKIKSGESPSKFDFVDSGVPYYKVEQLNSANKYLSESSFYIGTGCHSVKDSIVFPKRGASILLNKVRILTKDSYIDTNLMTLTVQEGLSNEFLYYFLLHFGLWRVADTTSIPQINNKHVNPLEIKLPDFEEQKSIAAVLKDIEEEIELHEYHLSKYRDLKQALMQQLLTGKIRLV